MEALKLLFLICFCFNLSRSEDSERVIELLERIDLMDTRMKTIETQLGRQEQCECNLTDIEDQIRQNGLTIAKVRHIVYLNDIRISENLDEINEIESTVDSVKLDLEASIDQVKLDLDGTNDTLKTGLDRVEKLEQLSKYKTFRTCHELASRGVTLSGVYEIDPDGDGIGQPPIQALCDFLLNTTEIDKDFAPQDQIDALIELSKTCYQDNERLICSGTYYLSNLIIHCLILVLFRICSS